MVREPQRTSLPAPWAARGLLFYQSRRSRLGAVGGEKRQLVAALIRLIRPRCEQPRGRTGELDQWPLSAGGVPGMMVGW